MKKMVYIAMALLLLSANCEARSNKPPKPPKIAQLIFGIAFIGVGAALAMDGFSTKTETTYTMVPVTENIDISNPQVTSFSGWAWDKEKLISWWADAAGAFTNTGNVQLNGIGVTIVYYDFFGSVIRTDATRDSSSSSFLSAKAASPDQAIAWQLRNTQMSIEPVTASITYTYSSYVPVYDAKTSMLQVRKDENKIKNPTLGIAGIVGASIGTYMVINYFVSRSRFTKQLTVVPTPRLAGAALQYRFSL